MTMEAALLCNVPAFQLVPNDSSLLGPLYFNQVDRAIVSIILLRI